MDGIDYIKKMKDIYNALLEFIDERSDENYHYLIKKLDISQTTLNCHELKSILYLIMKIIDNHHRSPEFFSNIFQILNILNF